MKKNNLMIILVLFAGIITLSSCKDDPVKPEENKHEDAFADVFVKKVKTSQGDKYGLVFYSGGEGLTSCEAKTPNGAEYNLVEFWKGAGNLRHHPTNNQMQGSMPQTGEYVFTLTFDDGVTKELIDKLENVEILSIKGVAVTHTAGTEEVSAIWNKVDGTDAYMVKLTDKNKNEKQPIFVNKKLTPTDLSYTFNKTTTASPGWMQAGKPSVGDTCYVMVVSVKYETGTEASARDQNKQINTVKPTMIIW